MNTPLKHLLPGAAASVLLLGSPVLASSGTAYTDYARVTAVEPVVRIVRVETPRRQCRDETVTVTEPAPRTYTPEILGSILGAAVGNQFGSGSGRDVATVAGAVLGGSLGHDYKNRRMAPYGRTYQAVERRCGTVHDVHDEERIDGYDVTYRYHGRDYTTRMDHDPGDRLRVRVDVTPAW